MRPGAPVEVSGRRRRCCSRWRRSSGTFSPLQKEVRLRGGAKQDASEGGGRLLWVDVFTLLRLLLFTSGPIRDSWLELSDRPLQLAWRTRAERGRSLCSSSRASGSKTRLR